MKEYSVKIGDSTIIRVNRTRAKKIYENGGRVTLCASNMRPDVFGVIVDNTDGAHFEKVENAFYYYNCNAETGKRINYFVEQ